MKVNDLATVMGDKEGMGHNFLSGTPVTLMRWDPADSTWLCRDARPDSENPWPRDEWWVADVDLEPALTDEDVQAAVASIKDALPKDAPLSNESKEAP